ncbi:MAG: NUDIX domain-containing protein [Candidatus Moranbacteria bacterium]|nr:NUDIX domain-containing protein [Candidatus Moranbacteria bacterium]
MKKNSLVSDGRVRVGVGVMVVNDSCEVLLGLRKSSHGMGDWSFPGGHLEFGETVFETARREVAEETGLVIDQFELVSVCDEMRYIKTDGKHYLNVSVLGVYSGGEPQVLEPQKCSQWQWFSVDALPEHLFEATSVTIRNYADGVVYREMKSV